MRLSASLPAQPQRLLLRTVSMACIENGTTLTPRPRFCWPSGSSSPMLILRRDDPSPTLSILPHEDKIVVAGAAGKSKTDRAVENANRSCAFRASNLALR